ncbi:DUF6541 family protein [Micromonospora sp. NPDC003197]
MAASLLFGPYLLIRWAAVGSIRAIDFAIAPPVSFALLSWLGLMLNLVDIRFSPLSVALGLVTPMVLLLVVRLLRQRRDPAIRSDSSWPRPRLSELLGLGAAGAFTISIWASSQRWVSGIPQYWDGIWHGYLVGTIMRRGLASPFELSPLDPYITEPVDVYPYGFHLVAALVGDFSSVASGINATQIAGAAFVATIGTLVATREVYGRDRIALVVAPVVIVLMSWWQVRNAGIPSYNMGMAMLPGAFAAVVHAQRTGWTPTRTILAGVAIAGLWLVQPASVFSMFVVLIPYALVQLWRRPVGERRISWRRIRAVVLLGMAAGLVALPWLLVTLAKVSDTLEATRARTMGLSESVLRVLLMSDPGRTTNWVLCVGVVLGLVLAVIGRIPRWLAGAWLLTAGLYVVAAGSENDELRRTLTGVWFTDWYRLADILAFVGALLLAGLASVLVARVRGTGQRIMIAVLAVAGVAAAVVAVPTNRTYTAALTTPSLVTPTEMEAARWVADQSQPGERALNQWSDGSPWGYAQYGTPVAVAYSSTVYRMRDRNYLISHFGELGSNPKVDASVLALRVRWVIVDETKLKSGAKAPQVPVGSPFVKVAYQAGQTTVYRLDLEALARSTSS